jgi:energy-coupling factor transporter transmembrane protein EcfT
MFLSWLVLIIVLAFIMPTADWQLFLLLLLFASAFFKGQLSDSLKTFRSFSPLLLLTLLIHLFLRFERPYFLPLSAWPLWEKSLFFTLRNGVILFGMTLIISRLQNMKLMEKFEAWELKARFNDGGNISGFIQPLLIGWRYFSLMRHEYKTLQQLHRILGLSRNKGIISQARYYGSMLMPMILMSLSRAELLGAAMTTRAYNSAERKRS